MMRQRAARFLSLDFMGRMGHRAPNETSNDRFEQQHVFPSIPAAGRQCQFVTIAGSRPALNLLRSLVGMRERLRRPSRTFSAAWATVKFPGRPGVRWEQCGRLLSVECWYPVPGTRYLVPALGRLLAGRGPPLSRNQCKYGGAAWVPQQLIRRPAAGFRRRCPAAAAAAPVLQRDGTAARRRPAGCSAGSASRPDSSGAPARVRARPAAAAGPGRAAHNRR